MLCDKQLSGRADAGGKLRTATELSLYIGTLHGCDNVGPCRYGSVWRSCMNSNSASRHKAEYNSRRSFWALEIRHCPCISDVNCKSLHLMLKQRHAVIYDEKVLCNTREGEGIKVILG